MTYTDLGGTGVPRLYAEVIGKRCPVEHCQARMGELCVDPDGRERRRPHLSRSLGESGKLDDSEPEKSSP